MLLYVQFIGEEQSMQHQTSLGTLDALKRVGSIVHQLLPGAAESGMDTLGWPSLALPCAFPAAKRL